MVHGVSYCRGIRDVESVRLRCGSEFGEQVERLRLVVGQCDSGAFGHEAARHGGTVATPGLRIGELVALCLRTERVSYSERPEGICSVPGVLKSRHYAGGAIRCVVALPSGRELVAVGHSGTGDAIRVGDPVFACWNPGEAAVVK